MEFIIGILCGIALSLVLGFGPAFFALVQNSLHYGFRKTISFILGVVMSDAIIVFLMLTVLKNANMDAILHNIYTASIGGAVIILIGVQSLRKKAEKVSDAQDRMSQKPKTILTHRWQLFLHGFALNFLNPLIWIYWVSIITFLSAEVGLTASDRYIFFAGLLIALLGCDMLKCRLATIMQRWFNPQVMKVFNRIIGTILIAFGLYLIISMILYQTNPKIRERDQEQPQSTKIIQTIHDRMGRDTNSADGKDSHTFFLFQKHNTLQECKPGAPTK